MSQPEMVGSFAAPPPVLPAPSPRRARLRRAGALVGAGVAVGAGFAVWQGGRILRDAPGQTAMEKLIPREALGAVAFDFKPRSWEQVQVLRRIGETAKSEGLADTIQEAQDETIGDSPVLREMRPYFTPNGAAAAWKGTGKDDYRWVAIGLVTAPGEVEKVLAKHAISTTTEDGVKVARLNTQTKREIASGDLGSQETAYVAVVGQYLVVSSTPTALRDVIAVWHGKRDALRREPQYNEFRATLPSDANFVGYVSPRVADALRESAAIPSQQAMADSFKNVQGGAFSMAVREAGLRFDSTASMTGKQMDALRQMATLDPKIASRLPSNALGFMALAQPTALYDATEAALLDGPAETREQWEKSKQKFESESGLSIANDIKPNVSGDLAVALYPGEMGADGTPVHFSALLTDARGAQPAALLEKVQGVVTKDSKGGEFVSDKQGSVTYWSATDGKTLPTSDPMFKGLTSADGKQMTLYATVGQTALVASSRQLLETAAKTYEGGSGFAPVGALPPNVQMLVVIRPRAVVDAVARLSPEAFSGDSLTADEMRQVWGDQDLVMSGTYGAKYATGSAFLPVRYEKAVSLLARAARESKTRRSSLTEVGTNPRY